MVATTDFLPFATGVGANVISQAAFASMTSLGPGFSAGLAYSNQLNKVWRQSSFVSAGLANFIITQTNVNAPDDGNLAAFVTNLTNAIKTLIATQNGHIYTFAGNPNGNVAGIAGVAGVSPPDICEDTTSGILWVCTVTGNAASAKWVSAVESNYFADTGTVNTMVITPVPAISAYAVRQRFVVKKSASANSGAVTLNVSGLGTKAVVAHDGTALVSGMIQTGEILDLIYDGTQFVWLDSPTSDTAPAGDSSTRNANTAFVTAAIAKVASNARLFFYAQL